jgi:hypothetical protein
LQAAAERFLVLACQKPQNITIQDNKLLFVVVVVVVWLRSSLTLAYQSYKYCIYI